MTAKPLILLIFANDRAAYLESITQERQQLLDLLEPWEERFGFQVKSIDYSTADGVIEALNTHHERLVMLHFAGHSKTDILHLDMGRAHANGLAAKLGNCPNLKLVFLNGCNNASLVRAIAEAGIPSVVGTSQRIADKLAADFSQSFFNALVAQGKNVAEAFQQAKSDVETVTGKGYRSLDLQAPLEERHEWAWFMESQQPTWKLADAFHPCSRLPALKRGELPAKPFKNLYYYTDADAEIFFGRCQAIWDVLTLLDETSEPLLLLHGGTGVGKSSFLQAGLIPRLKAPARQQVVHYIRYSELDSQQNFLLQLFGSTDFATIHAKLDTPTPAGRPAIWIIDQMEEIFFSDESVDSGKANIPPTLDVLLMFFHDIFYPSKDRARPNAKLIFSLRKEWFAELYSACHKFGMNHYLLKSLDKNSIVEIIEAPARIPYLKRSYHLRINNPLGGSLAERIADDLLVDKNSNVAPTLQIILSRLWDRCDGLDERNWDEDLYLDEKRTGLLLEDYIDQQLKDISLKEPWGKEAKETGLLLDVLYAHTTVQGTINLLTFKEYNVNYAHIKYRMALLKALKDRYLLIEQKKDKMSLPQTRLAHDTLVQLINVRYFSSELLGQRARRLINQYKAEWDLNIKYHKMEGPFLGRYELRVVNKGQRGTIDWRKNPIEWNIILKSRRKVLFKNIFSSVFLFFLLVVGGLFFYYYNKLSPEAVINANINTYHLIKQESDKEKVGIYSKILPIVRKIENKFMLIDDYSLSNEYLFYKHAILADLYLTEIKILAKYSELNAGLSIDFLVKKAIIHVGNGIAAIKLMDDNFVENRNGVTGNRLFNTLLMSLQIYSWKYCQGERSDLTTLKQIYAEIPIDYIDLYKDEHDQCFSSVLGILKEKSHE